ncbi:MAG: hypothetical protein AAGK23_01795 [Pseudomonadota bacterium]
MLRFIFLVAFAAGICVSAVAERGYVPPPVGTQVTWVTQTDQGSATRVSEVVATGPDFAIYLYDLGWDAEDATSFFAEFSGLHMASCAADMPDANERIKLRSFWPLEAGRSLQIGDEYDSTYIVGEAVQHAVSQSEGPKPARLVTAVVGKSRTDMMLSLEWNTPVALGWGDGSAVDAIEVFTPSISKSIDEDDRFALGNCANLLAGSAASTFVAPN